MKDVFLAPGRILEKLFSQEKKKTYRSTRQRPGVGLGTVALSLLGWLIVAGVVLLAMDKLGLLHKALDVGVEAAQKVNGEAAPVPGAPAPGSVTGSIAAGGQAGTAPSPAADTAAAPAQAVETELWLVILHTIPKASREEAERRQTGYLSRGLPVEILDTDAFPRLKSGNWIIAQGPFDDRASALAAADAAKAFNTGLIVRRGL
jgi:hypothetical protein